MQANITTYQRTYSIKDEAFDTEALSFYYLDLLFSSHEFSFIVTDSRDQKVLCIEHYTFPEVFSVEQQLSHLSILYQEHIFLTAGYWKQISLCVQNDKFSLIPSILFNPQDIKAYLKLNADTQNDDVLISDFIEENNSYNCFAVDKSIENWFSKSYYGKEIKITHHLSSFIRGIEVQHHLSNEEETVYLNISAKSVTIGVISNRKLVFANVFQYASPDDLLYYLMFVLNEFSLDPNQVLVTIWGEIDQTSMEFAKLYRYIRYLQFGKRPQFFNFSYVFDELFDHQSFDLYNISYQHLL